MKFNFVEERVYFGKLKKASFKDIAFSSVFRCHNVEMEDLIDPILIIAKQNNLNIKITERLEPSGKMIYLEYENDDIVKALHILNVCTTLN